MAKKVRSGLVTAWRLAGWPTRRSPSSVKATIEGVVRAPSAFSMTLGVEPSMTATQEFVVPRSMPITFAITYPCSFLRDRRAPKRQGLEDAFHRSLCSRRLTLPIPIYDDFRQFTGLATQPASRGVYRGGVLVAQGAEAVDFSSFDRGSPDLSRAFPSSLRLYTSRDELGLPPHCFSAFCSRPSRGADQRAIDAARRCPRSFARDDNSSKAKTAHKASSGGKTNDAKLAKSAAAAGVPSLAGRPLMLNGKSGLLQISGDDKP